MVEAEAEAEVKVQMALMRGARSMRCGGRVPSVVLPVLVIATVVVVLHHILAVVRRRLTPRLRAARQLQLGIALRVPVAQSPAPARTPTSNLLVLVRGVLEASARARAPLRS